MPDSTGSTWTHPSAGSVGASRSTSRSGPTPAPRPEPKRRHDARRGEARQRPLEEERAHRPMTALGAFTSKGPKRQRPVRAALAPWPSAPRASPGVGRWPRAATSGLTATGKPTASSMARSLAESA